MMYLKLYQREWLTQVEFNCFPALQTVFCVARLDLMQLTLGVCANFGAEQEQN